MTPSTPKSFVLLASGAPTGVVLYRRSHLTTHVLKFNYGMHGNQYRYRLLKGARFRGRLFPERCDVSPDGKLLVYFAMRGRKTDGKSDPATWTAISVPPQLTALLFCPNGTTWGGGGQFLPDRKLVLFDSMENTRDTKEPEFQGYRIIRDISTLRPAELDHVRAKWKPAKVTELRCPVGPARKGRAVLVRSLKPGVASGYDCFDYVLRDAEGNDVEGAEDIVLANWAGWDVFGRLMVASGRFLRIYEVHPRKPLPKPLKTLDLEVAIA